MTDAVMALNAGSSSFKFAVASTENVSEYLLSGTVERIGSDNSILNVKSNGSEKTVYEIGRVDHQSALQVLFDEIARHEAKPRILGTGHRIVHGGSRFAEPVVITSEIIEQIDALVPLAPLHQPHGLKGILASLEAFADATHVACFDTAFHAKNPWVHTAYALPRKYYDEGIRSYGFHGLACQSVCQSLLDMNFPLFDRKIVIAHLGNGCSVTAVRDGVSLATSMGFSTLDGLTMGTRCGRIDPGVLLHLLRSGLSADELEKTLYHESGLLGLSAVSNDMRDLLEADTALCRQSIDFFTTRLIEEIGRLASAMCGLDCIVFSGGIGENASAIREDVAAGLQFLKDRTGAALEIRVVPADEERELLSAALQTGLKNARA